MASGGPWGVIFQMEVEGNVVVMAGFKPFGAGQEQIDTLPCLNLGYGKCGLTDLFSIFGDDHFTIDVAEVDEVVFVRELELKPVAGEVDGFDMNGLINMMHFRALRAECAVGANEAIEAE